MRATRKPHTNPKRERGLPSLTLRVSVVAVCLAFLACGCTSLSEFVHNGFKVGPNYQRPPAPLAPEKVAGGWRLTVRLPFAHKEDVELTRWRDDLVVTAAGARRSIPLDSLLRRCRVTGGTLGGAGTADARLEVGFEPDPQQWPADLLSAHERTAAEEESS